MNTFFPKKIFLIGFIASGKSTIGKNLSSILGYKFIDTDKEIERKLSSTIKDLINLEGEEKFREIEWELIKSMKNEDNIVVALSSGAGASYSILDFIKKFAFVIFLNTPWNIILRRIEEKKELLPQNIKIEGLYKIFVSRYEIYKKAHLVLNLYEYERMEETSLRIERLIREYFNEIPYNF
mgnify:CR=1 FL=1